MRADSQKAGTVYAGDYVDHGMCKMKLNQDLIESVRPIVVSFKHKCNATNPVRFYRAMHYSANGGLAIACRLSVRLSVTLVDHNHIG